MGWERDQLNTLLNEPDPQQELKRRYMFFVYQALYVVSSLNITRDITTKQDLWKITMFYVCMYIYIYMNHKWPSTIHPLLLPHMLRTGKSPCSMGHSKLFLGGAFSSSQTLKLPEGIPSYLVNPIKSREKSLWMSHWISLNSREKSLWMSHWISLNHRSIWQFSSSQTGTNFQEGPTVWAAFSRTWRGWWKSFGAQTYAFHARGDRMVHNPSDVCQKTRISSIHRISVGL